jgi:hypothetical protein
MKNVSKIFIGVAFGSPIKNININIVNRFEKLKNLLKIVNN